MPSPIGHALAGAAAAWTADLVPGDRSWRTADPSAGWYHRAGGGLTLTCIALAAAPDLDLLIPHAHRTFSHSIAAAALVGLAAAIVAARARRPIVRLALMCGVAYGTHVLMDWLGVDRYPPRGIQALWPFTHAWYISDLDVFRQTAREDMLDPANVRVNVLAIAQEIAIMLPIVAALWLIRVKALARFATEVTRRHHAPQ